VSTLKASKMGLLVVAVIAVFGVITGVAVARIYDGATPETPTASAASDVGSIATESLPVSVAGLELVASAPVGGAGGGAGGAAGGTGGGATAGGADIKAGY